METQSEQSIQERPHRRRWFLVLVRLLCGVVLAVLVCIALTLLIGSESLQVKLESLGFGQRLSVSALLVISAVITLAYTLHPLLGSVIALVLVFPVLASYHFGLAVLYAVCGVLALPCLGKCGGVFLFVLAGLAAVYPPLAPAVIFLVAGVGLLYGRGVSWYVAGVLVLVVLIAGLVVGREHVGVLRTGDGQPLMESEGMVTVREAFLPLDLDLPAETRENPWGKLGLILILSLTGGWLVLWPLCAYGVLALELWPRLLPLLPQVLVWAIVGEAVAWVVWVLRRKLVSSVAVLTEQQFLVY